MDFSSVIPIEDVKEEYNTSNSMHLIVIEEEHTQSYLNFVYDLFSEWKNEIFEPIFLNAPNVKGTDEFETYEEILPYRLDDEKATCINEKLCDHYLVNAIFSIQTILSRRKMNRNISEFINCMMGYKNSCGRECSHILRRSNIDSLKPQMKELFCNFLVVLMMMRIAIVS